MLPEPASLPLLPDARRHSVVVASTPAQPFHSPILRPPLPFRNSPSIPSRTRLHLPDSEHLLLLIHFPDGQAVRLHFSPSGKNRSPRLADTSWLRQAESRSRSLDKNIAGVPS